MLLTSRLPIADLRGLARDETIVRSVVLPAVWSTGAFVRGFGPVTARPNRPVEPWLYEEAYADLSRTVTFSQPGLENYNQALPDYSVQKIRKRAWMALPHSTAMFDVDVALQLGPRHGSPDRRRETGTFSVSDLKKVVQAAAALSVRIGPVNTGSSASLLRAGKALAERYNFHTSAGSPPRQLVRAGTSVAVLEAPGLRPADEKARTNRFGVAMTSFTIPVIGGGQLRTHVLWDTEGTADNRKRIREARIHILRLQSIREFLRFLASMSRDETLLASKPSHAGYDPLQRTLLSCIRIADRNALEGHIDPEAILNAAFPHERIFENDLEILLKRTLAGMRPKVPAEAQAFIYGEKQRVVSPDVKPRSQESVVHNYHITANNIGAVGDNAKIKNLKVGTEGRMLEIGGQSVAVGPLLEELRKLDATATNDDSLEATECSERIRSIEASLEAGDDEGAVASLRKLGRWAMSSSNTLGLTIVASAVTYALGLS